MSITIKDIAKIANVSHTTVSRALNDSPLISDHTKQRIKKIAKEHNYIPNISAKGLKLDKSYNIGLFYTTIETGTSSSFLRSSLSGVNEVIKNEYNLVIKGIVDFNRDFGLVNKKHFDGILIASQSSEDDEFIKHVNDSGIPLIVMNRKIDVKDVTCIYFNDEDGAYRATEYLIQNGHKKIGFIKGKEGFLNTLRRENGYLKALMEYNIPSNKDLITDGQFDIESGYNGIKKILEKTKPTAIFCSNDEMAVGAMKALYKEGFELPKDFSIVGFDDSEICKYVTPELTTVRRSIHSMSKKAANMLIDCIKNKSSNPKHISLESELIERNSVYKIG